MKTHFKTTRGEKGDVYHPERILNDTLSTIHGFPPCLAASKPHYNDQHSWNAPLKAHLRALISPNRKKYIFQSHHSPSSPVYPRRHYKFFGFTRLFDLNMKTQIKTSRRKRLRILSRTNVRRYIFSHSRFLHPGREYVLSTIHGFSTLAANSKPHIIVPSRKQ